MNRQIIIALTSLVIVIVLTMLLMSRVETVFLNSWLVVVFIFLVPMQVAWGDLLADKKPTFIVNLPQPWSGLIVIACCFMVSVLISYVAFLMLEPGAKQPGPILISYSILVVVSSFWFTIVWQYLPIQRWIKNPVALRFSVVLVGLLFGWLILNVGYNFNFLEDVEGYNKHNDPNGYFTSWYITAFLVTTVAVMFSLVLLDFHFTRAYAQLPLKWSFANTLLILVLSSIIYIPIVVIAGVDPVFYLVNFVVSYIFGVFVPLNLFNGQIAWRVKQPYRGFLLISVSILGGFILNRLYILMAQFISPEISTGFPAYELEIWLANAMLAFSFPMVVALTVHLNFWPLSLIKSFCGLKLEREI